MPRLRAPEPKRVRAARAGDFFRPAPRSRRARSARERRNRRLLRWLFHQPGNVQRGQRPRARELRKGLPFGAFASDRRNIDKETDSTGAAVGEAAVSWSTASGARATARIWSSSNRRFPIIGRKRRRSAMPTRSSCRGSHTCDGAATRWCWNRRAPALCSKFATRRLRPSSPTLHPAANQTAASAGRFSGGRASRFAPGLPNPFQGWRCCRRKELRPAEGDHSLVLWEFHDLLFHARSTEGRHANPLGGVYPHVGIISPLPAVRPSWPGKKIDLRKVSTGRPGRSRRSRSFCVNVIRRAASTTSDRSRSPSSRSFLTARRASCRDWNEARTLTKAVTP